MEYKIIDEDSVNKRLSEGWELYGPPFYDPIHVSIVQAMTRSFTEPFRVVSGILGVVEAEAVNWQKNGYIILSRPMQTGKMIEIAGDEHPEVAVIMMKKED